MSSKPKLLVIGGVPPPFHGVTIFTERMLKARLGENFDIQHLDTSDHRDMSNLSRFDFMNVVLATKSIIGLIWKLLRNRPDIVYLPISVAWLPFVRDGLFIVVAKSFSRAAIVIHLHGGKYFREQFFASLGRQRRSFVSFTLRQVDLAIVLGNELKSTFQDLVARTCVVPNGTDFTIPAEILLAKRGGPHSVRVGFLGNLKKAKGYLDVIASAKDVVSQCDNVLFKIAGPWCEQESELRGAALAFIDQNRLEGKIEFPGLVVGRAKEEFFAGIDLFVFPSLNEGLPLVILEAMASGCPVISTKGVGAISEVVEDGVTGILVPPNDVKALAEAICLLVKKPELRESMARAARQKFEQHYTMEHNVQGLQLAFESLLISRHGRRP